MKKKTDYRKAPQKISEAIKVAEIIEDFLPAPDKLVKKEDSVKVTILLSADSVDFFKSRAKVSGIPYQAMIRAVLDRYAAHYRDNG